MKLKKFYIPQQHYIGLAIQKDRTLPWALMTPYSTDVQANRRMTTINNWLSKKADKVSTPAIMDNVPMSGFVLTQLIRRGEYGASDKWVVQDPRGFELEISSENVAEIFSNAMVDKGHVSSPLIWTRKGKVNWLVVKDSQAYTDALDQVVCDELNTDWDSVKLGSIVKLTDGTNGQYMGKMWGIVETMPNIHHAHQERFAVTPTPNYVVHAHSSSITWTSRYTQELLCSPWVELDSVVIKGELSVEQCEQKANQLLNEPSCYLRCSRGRQTRLMSGSPIKKGSWSYQLTAIDQADLSYEDVLNDFGDQTVIVETYDHTWGAMVKKFKPNTCTIWPIDKSLLDQGQFCYLTKPTTKGNFVGSYVKQEVEKNLTQIKNMYLIDVKMITKVGHEVKAKI